MAAPLEAAETAASSISARRSDGFEPSTVSTRPARSPSAGRRRGRRRREARPGRCGGRRPVDQVLALAVAVEAPGEGDLGVRADRPGTVGVVEEEVDLAVVGRLAPAEPANSTSSGFSARSSSGLSSRSPTGSSRRVRFAGAVRPDDDRHAGLEVDLDRIDERLEAAELDRLQMHAKCRLSSGQDAARTRLYFVPAPTSNSHGPRTRPRPRTRRAPPRSPPRPLARRLGEPGEHLMERTERLPLEPRALGRRGKPQRRFDARCTRRPRNPASRAAPRAPSAVNGPGQPRAGRRQLGEAPDDRDRDREEAVAVGLGEDDRRVAAARRAGPHGRCGERAGLSGRYIRPEPGDRPRRMSRPRRRGLAVHHSRRDVGEAGGRAAAAASRGCSRRVGGEHAPRRRARPRRATGRPSPRRCRARAAPADGGQVEHLLGRLAEPSVEERVPAVPGSGPRAATARGSSPCRRPRRRSWLPSQTSSIQPRSSSRETFATSSGWSSRCAPARGRPPRRRCRRGSRSRIRMRSAWPCQPPSSG